jgi:integrase
MTSAVCPSFPKWASSKSTRASRLSLELKPNILYKEQYKALLYEASDNIRDYAIIQTFLQTGIRLSELVNLTVICGVGQATGQGRGWLAAGGRHVRSRNVAIRGAISGRFSSSAKRSGIN